MTLSPCILPWYKAKSFSFADNRSIGTSLFTRSLRCLLEDVVISESRVRTDSHVSHGASPSSASLSSSAADAFLFLLERLVASSIGVAATVLALGTCLGSRISAPTAAAMRAELLQSFVISAVSGKLVKRGRCQVSGRHIKLIRRDMYIRYACIAAKLSRRSLMGGKDRQKMRLEQFSGKVPILVGR